MAPRVAVLSHYMGSSLTPEEIIADFKTFYYDTALSAHDHTLLAMKAFVGAERIVFGTDFPGEFTSAMFLGSKVNLFHPAVSKDMAAWYTKNADDFYQPAEKDMVMRSNLLNILSNINNVMSDNN